MVEYSLEGLEVTEKLQRDHVRNIEAIKEELAKVKSAGEEKLFLPKFHFHSSFLWLGAESMQKMERRFSKTLLTMSKKFLSLEGDIENISCEGTVEYKNNTYHVQIIVSQ